MEDYPAIAFLVRYGAALSVAVTVLPIVAALFCVAAIGMHWAVIVAGVVLGLLAGFMMKVIVELTVIITDMLLPK